MNYRKASEIIAEPSLKYKAFWLTHYISVGDFNTACEISDFYRKNDPLNPHKRASYFFTA
jgi:hypothetical protein